MRVWGHEGGKAWGLAGWHKADTLSRCVCDRGSTMRRKCGYTVSVANCIYMYSCNPLTPFPPWSPSRGLGF